MSYLKNFLEILQGVQISFKTEKGQPDYDTGIDRLVTLFTEYRESKNNIFFIGNGGSAAIACHMTADFMKNGRLRTVSLYNSSVLTCLGNDYSYEEVFSRQLEFLMHEEDLLVVISSSGESANILRAIETAKNKGGKVLSFTGFEEKNRARQMSDASIYVPSFQYGIVESIHNLILQQIVDLIMVD